VIPKDVLSNGPDSQALWAIALSTRKVGTMNEQRADIQQLKCLAAPIQEYHDYPINHPNPLPRRRVAHLAAQPELGLWPERRSRDDPHNPAGAVFVAHHLEHGELQRQVAAQNARDFLRLERGRPSSDPQRLFKAKL
jgi:hypothetical protein